MDQSKVNATSGIPGLYTNIFSGLTIRKVIKEKLQSPAKRRVTMPYYSETESRDLRLKVEEIVLEWPGVTKKILFGSPAYTVGKAYFAMLVTGGIILTRLGEEEKVRLLKDPRAGYFEGHGRVMKKWIHVTVSSPTELGSYLPYLRSSYEAAHAGAA
jgi:hypothetical protein